MSRIPLYIMAAGIGVAVIGYILSVIASLRYGPAILSAMFVILLSGIHISFIVERRRLLKRLAGSCCPGCSGLYGAKAASVAQPLYPFDMKEWRRQHPGMLPPRPNTTQFIDCQICGTRSYFRPDDPEVRLRTTE